MGFDQHIAVGYGFTFTWDPTVHTQENIFADVEKRGYRRSDIELVGFPIMYTPDNLAQIGVAGPYQVVVYAADTYFHGKTIDDRPYDHWCRFRTVSPKEAKRFYTQGTMPRIRRGGIGTKGELARLRRFMDTKLDVHPYGNLMLTAMDAVGWRIASAASFIESDVAAY